MALDAFDSFCRGAEDGRFPLLADRDDLWHLLVVLTARKAFDLLRHELRPKRGGGQVRGESALLAPGDDPEEEAGIARVIGDEPTPEFAAQVAEEYRRLLEVLGDEELRAVARWRMEGYTNAEIAARLGCAEPTVERRLRVIRSIWGSQAARP